MEGSGGCSVGEGKSERREGGGAKGSEEGEKEERRERRSVCL